MNGVIARRNRSRKNQNVLVSFVYDSVAYDPVKTRLVEVGSRSGRTNQSRGTVSSIDWFIPPLLLATPAMQFYFILSDVVICGCGCSASNSVGLIFSRSYISTLLSDNDSDYDSVASENQP